MLNLKTVVCHLLKIFLVEIIMHICIKVKIFKISIQIEKMWVIEKLKKLPIEKQKIEIVERKGLGHPDYICDAIMDSVSVELCKEYLKRFGAIMHHNIDKGLLVAGRSEKRFGGGRILEPMKLIFGDRATFDVDGNEIDVKGIAIKTAKKWIKENLRFVDPENIIYQVELKPGSPELVDIFKRGGRVLGANDTSAAVGYAPLSETERIVLLLERYLNSKKFLKAFPEGGEDVKVMAYRENRTLDLTISMAFVDRFVKNEADYFRKKENIVESAKEFVEEKIDKEKIEKFSTYLNTLDKPGRGLGGVYLTVTGTTAEDADCGEVGRGNRVNGLIALNRPTGTEAAAGKNPVSHIGKIYNVLAHKIANEIYSKVNGIKEIYVWLCSQIGMPIDKPKVVAVQLITDEEINEIGEHINDIITKELEHMKRFTMDLAKGKYSIC